MPLGLGLAVSHAPGLYASTEEGWDAMWHRMSVDRDIPQPKETYGETGDRLKEIIRRIKAGHDELAAALDDYKPDLLIILGGDQTEMFDRSNVPQLMIYLGEKAAGPIPGPNGMGYGPGETAPQLELDVDVEFSRWLLNKLVKQEGFDVSFSSEMRNFGRRPGLPHAFINPSSVLLKNTKPKTCLVYMNTFDGPSLSAQRCFEFGQAIARLVKNDPRRIAILASGGLSHDPGGKRSGWVDVPMDLWFLDRLAEGNARATEAMFTFDSDTMVSGTGENRCWIAAAAAMEEMGSHATVVDYIEASKTVTGLGFAYWPVNNEAAAVSR